MEAHGGEHHGPFVWVENIPLLPHGPEYVHVNGAVVVFFVILAVSLVANRAIKRNSENFIIPPRKFGLVAMVDLLIEGIYNMLVGTLGKDTRKYFPFIASVFIFILLGNLMGLLPLSAAPTASVNTTYALGAAAFIYYNYMGIKSHGLVGYGKHFLMGMGLLGVPIALLEMISHFIRPLSLGLRLFVNMHVDHTVVLSFQNIFAWLTTVPLLLFGVIICTIQAFVFTILTAVYVQMATEH